MQMDLEEKFSEYKTLLERIYDSIKEESSDLDFYIEELEEVLKEIDTDSMDQSILRGYLDKYNIFNLHLCIGKAYEVKRNEIQNELNKTRQSKKAFMSYGRGKSDNKVFNEEV